MLEPTSGRVAGLVARSEERQRGGLGARSNAGHVPEQYEGSTDTMGTGNGCSGVLCLQAGTGDGATGLGARYRLSSHIGCAAGREQEEVAIGRCQDGASVLKKPPDEDETGADPE